MLPFAALVTLVVFHAREAIFEGRAFYTRDLHLQWFGQIESFVRTVHSGSLPLWDPWVSFGQPMLANANAQVLYPPTWLNLLMRPWTYYTVYLVAHLLLAGWGARSLARRLGASGGGALLAAAFWISSGPVLSLGNLWNHLAGAAWLPWILDATLRALDAPSARRSLAWGACLAATVLAGSPDFAVLGGLLSTAFVAARVASASSWPERRCRLAAAAAALLLAVSLAAAQVLPSAEIASRSERWSQSAQERTYWSLHPAGLVQTVVPVPWTALAALPSWSQALYEGREPYLFSVYLGVPALVLGVVALERRRRRDAVVLGTSLVVATILALGRHTPLYATAVALVPPLRLIRFPSKTLVVTALALALLAGLGYDALKREARGRPRLAQALALLLAFAALAGAGALARSSQLTTVRSLSSGLLIAGALAAASFALVTWRRVQGAAGMALGLLAVVAPTWPHRSLNPTAPLSLYTVRPDVLESLRQGSSQRLFVYDYLATPGRSRERLGRDAPYVVPGAPPTALWLQALGQRLYLLPPVGAAYGILDSFGRDLLGTQPTPLARLNAVTLLSDGTPAFARLLRLGSVNQALALHDLGPDLPQERAISAAFAEDLRLHRVLNPVPRATVVSGVRVSAEPLQALLDPGFDPEREVLLPLGESRASRPDFQGSVRIVEERPDRLRLAATASSSAWIVLVDSYDPGWRATLDGKETAVLAANMAFRAVGLPAGSHSVEMTYRPAPVLVGAVLSLGSGVLAVGILLRTA